MLVDRPGGQDPITLLRRVFSKALAELSMAKVLPPALPAVPAGRTVVVGAGKAAAAAGQALERHWPGDLTGLVVVPHGYALPCERIRVVEASHPVPDEAGVTAAKQILELVSGLSPDDLVIALFSGGASALLPLPAGEVTMEDKRDLTGQLLRCGASIGEINCVRKHLSGIKGGRLACACAPAAVANLLVSDVAGDDPSVIASGPAVPDRSTLAEAREVLERYDLRVSDAVRHHLAQPEHETPKPGSPCFARVTTTIVSSSQALLEKAAWEFSRLGLTPMILSDCMEGESRQVALVHAAVARQVARHGQPVPPPCVLLSGGETTVTVRGEGRGGPNAEFLLSLAVALGDEVNYAALACDTDGQDGAGEAAGAVASSDTMRRATAAGLHARKRLDENDSHSFFASLGDSVVTGPTFNNLNDFRAILVLPWGTRPEEFALAASNEARMAPTQTIAQGGGV
jgi:hydroxypyruvate reductase